MGGDGGRRRPLRGEAFLLGDCRDRQRYPKMIKDRTRAPVIAMNETPCLEQTLDLFAAGVDGDEDGGGEDEPAHVVDVLADQVHAARRPAPPARRAAKMLPHDN